MELILWRHAEAADGLPDAGRRLTSKGEKQARLMAKWLGARLPPNTRILSSPTARTRQTVEALELDYDTDEAIGAGGTVSDVLRSTGWPEAKGCVLVVGHQPTLGRVAAYLLTGEESDWVIKKGALWWFERRARDGDETVLRAVLGPDLVD